ncbi:MAG: hypothetical protein OK452_10700 [Thaumarchaeota archaeon]|nr:hypothetical protein [Nitrososphaerota archaeon]
MRGFIKAAAVALLITAALGFLLLFLTTEVLYIECAQKASSCSDSFYSIFNLLVVGFSLVGIAGAGGRVAREGESRRAATRDVSIFAINGLVLVVLYGMFPTLLEGGFGFAGETIYYGYPFTDFVQSGVNSFYPWFIVLNYMFWFALGTFTWLTLRILRGPKSEKAEKGHGTST